MNRTLPRLLAVTDMKGWAFENIARALATSLSDRIDIRVVDYVSLARQPAAVVRQLASEVDGIYCFSAIMPDVVYEVLSVAPIVAGIHSQCSMEHRPGMFVPERFARFRGVGCVNARIAAAARGLGLHDRIIVTSNGVDEQLFTPPTRTRIGPIRAGWAGAARRSEGDVKRFESVIVPACRAAGIDLRAVVREVNYLPPHLMPGYYRGVDVYLCASTSEGSQGPLVEAAASGCALLSTRVGIAEELIVHGVNGFLLDGTIDAFVERLKWCRRNPDETRAMGAAARQTILRNWTWTQRAENYWTLFSLALGPFVPVISTVSAASSPL